MAENETPEMGTDTATETGAADQTEQQKPEMAQITAEEWANTQAALKKANAEAAKYRKAAEAAGQAQKAQEEAEMTELQKATKRLAELEAEIQRRELDDKKRAIAVKVGLPDVLATRITGETDEELEADARAILEALPKAEKPERRAPGIQPSNPGASGATGESDAERRKRLGL